MNGQTQNKMDGPSSILTKRIHAKYKDRILELNRQGKSLIGEKFEIDGKTYVMTDGELNYNLDDFKSELEKYL